MKEAVNGLAERIDAVTYEVDEWSGGLDRDSDRRALVKLMGIVAELNRRLEQHERSGVHDTQS